MRSKRTLVRGRVTTAVPVDDSGSGRPDRFDAITDPVCGVVMDRETARFHAKHAERVFYFCSVHCQQEFLADQSGFLHAAPKAADAPCAAIEGHHYICSVNPDFICKAPGTYPDCGMVPGFVQQADNGTIPER